MENLSQIYTHAPSSVLRIHGTVRGKRTVRRKKVWTQSKQVSSRNRQCNFGRTDESISADEHPLIQSYSRPFVDQLRQDFRGGGARKCDTRKTLDF